MLSFCTSVLFCGAGVKGGEISAKQSKRVQVSFFRSIDLFTDKDRLCSATKQLKVYISAFFGVVVSGGNILRCVTRSSMAARLPPVLEVSLDNIEL